MNEILKERIEEEAFEFSCDRGVLGSTYNAYYDGVVHGGLFALAHQWINFKNNPPKSEDQIIVRLKNILTNETKTWMCYMHTICRFFEENPETEWKITHWMSIPELEEE